VPSFGRYEVVGELVTLANSAARPSAARDHLIASSSVDKHSRLRKQVPIAAGLSKPRGRT
jgi:hypothetical protein